MKLSVRFFSSLYVLLLCVSVGVSATQVNKTERWFEIEVILFKQLSDKKLLKEQFPDNISSVNLPQYKKHFDLLTPYLQPNLSGIKQFIPLCGKKDAQNIFLESLQKINTPFSDAITAIEHIDNFIMPELTAKQSALAFDLHKKELASPLFSTQNICIISRSDIKEVFSGEQLTNFQLDAFDVEALPAKLNASGTHFKNSPYLIANDSLKLADIKQRLQWSKEFKPLLHFGWRQVGVTRDKAIPLKLFAGQHLNNQYQKALNDHQSAIDNAIPAEQLTFQKFNNIEQQEVDGVSTEIKQQQFTQLFNDLKSVESADINSLIGDIELQTFDELTTINEANMSDYKQLNVGSPPKEPLQPWFLDGFLKVHLDHYLYITADFNILGQSLIKSTDNDSDKVDIRVINFSQNKRAITGEIHYFDHPYVGMIIQIRRFDPSKSKENAVTQVVN